MMMIWIWLKKYYESDQQLRNWSQNDLLNEQSVVHQSFRLRLKQKHIGHLQIQYIKITPFIDHSFLHHVLTAHT